mmetsp:Transcript_7577/g.9454  ORF Transcript_7577/g.9454 Transcript_7577/m.9454 type:complete len:118 (-) Transcript_7577:67-420(-)
MNDDNSTSKPLLTRIENEVLGREIKCTLNDGRITRGKLICLDRMKNMILADAIEERKVLKSMYDVEDNTIGGGGERKEQIERANEGEEYFMFRRDISQVLIPGDQLLKVELCRVATS